MLRAAADRAEGLGERCAEAGRDEGHLAGKLKVAGSDPWGVKLPMDNLDASVKRYWDDIGNDQ